MSDDPEEKPSLSIRVRRRPTTDSAAPPKAPTEGEEQSYKTGYKHPPLASRFQPGRSGNPKGRPRGSKNWTTIMAEAAGRRRTIGVGGKKVRMSGSEAVAEQMVINAIKGCPKARRDFLNEMRFERQGDAPPAAETTTPESLSANDEKLLKDFFERGRPKDTEDESS
jgi:hypothetical protein